MMAALVPWRFGLGSVHGSPTRACCCDLGDLLVGLGEVSWCESRRVSVRSGRRGGCSDGQLEVLRAAVRGSDWSVILPFVAEELLISA